MNRQSAKFQLSELVSHIEDVIKDIDAGRYDDDGDVDVVYQVDLGHLLDHLSRAWHFAHMCDDQIDSLTQEQYEQITHAIPKLGIDQRLVESWEKPI